MILNQFEKRKTQLKTKKKNSNNRDKEATTNQCSNTGATKVMEEQQPSSTRAEDMFPLRPVVVMQPHLFEL